MVRAYVDQNFLIYCSNSHDRHARALEVVLAGAGRYVLSPWHFFEIGKIDPARSEELIQVAESLEPEWILDRSDLEVGEFGAAWSAFYGFSDPGQKPIGSLADMASVLLRAPVEKLAKFTLRDFVRVFQIQGTRNLNDVLDSQQAIAAANQVSVQQGLMTPQMIENIEVAYINLMLARSRETASDEKALRLEESRIRQDSFLQGLVRHFVRTGGMNLLRAWQVESALTNLHHVGQAKLNHNRQVDRQHAVTGLAYCDRFITDDKELLRLCAEVVPRLPFVSGVAQTFDGFLESVVGSGAPAGI